jgi:mannosyltransferase
MNLSRAVGRIRDAALARPWFCVGLITLLSFGLCFHDIAARALWNDEAFSFFVAHEGALGALSYIQQDTQPPFYYAVLGLWLHLGHSSLVLRSLSALAIVAAVPLVYDSARRLLGVRSALCAAALFALSPECIGWAQIARPYALQALLVAISFWGFIRIWQEARPQAPAVAWLAYVLGGGLAVLAQYPAVFFLVGCNAAVAIRITRAGHAERPLVWRWLAGQLWFAVVWLPWLLPGVRQVFGNLTPGEIAAHHGNYLIGTAAMLDTVASRFAIAGLWRGRALSMVLVGAVALIGFWYLVRRPHRGLPVLAVVFVPLAVCVLAFFAVHPVFGYVIYTFAWLQIGMAMLLAAGLLAMRPRLAGALLLCLLLLGDAKGVLGQWQRPHVPLDKVAATIGADLRPGDGVVFGTGGGGRWALAYYLGPPYSGRLAGISVAVEAMTGWPISTVAEARRQRRLWVVLAEGETLPFDPEQLAPAMTRVLRLKLNGVLVDRYDRNAE